MTPNGLDAIVEVSLFLEQDILPSAPADLKGELRAAIKVLHSAAAELNVMAPILRQECAELLNLHEQSTACLAPKTRAQPHAALCARLAYTTLDLRDLLALHEEVQKLTTADMTDLLELSAGDGAVAARSRTLLLAYYQILEQHACRRLPWQSVFAGPLEQDLS